MNIEEGASVLGLDFVQRSEIVCGRPYLQAFAYAQVLHGSRLNFSFAEHHSGIVSFAVEDSRRPWTLGLEWLPHLVKYRDFFQFDYVLMSGSEAIHREIGSLPVLSRVTSGGIWQLYRCAKDSARGPQIQSK
jgi:hypothetical protein